jgi:hypothetical protein
MTVRVAKRAAAAGRAKQVRKERAEPSPSKSIPAPPTATSRRNGRYAAPAARLGMTPAEVRACAGQPECILFGPDDHVEWQFGRRGVDPVGSPCLYVTTLTFATGRVVRVTERITEPGA